MLIQLDGSYHRWLADHSPSFTLLLAVDDATGSVVNALFCNHEDSHNYFLLMQNLLSGAAASPWPSIPTATRSSSTRPDPGRPERPPSSDGRWQNWVSR